MLHLWTYLECKDNSHISRTADDPDLPEQGSYIIIHSKNLFFPSCITPSVPSPFHPPSSSSLQNINLSLAAPSSLFSPSFISPNTSHYAHTCKHPSPKGLYIFTRAEVSSDK